MAEYTRLVNFTNDHMSILREFHTIFGEMSPCMPGFERCESLFMHLKNRMATAGEYLARHCSGIQQSLETKESGNAYWRPGLEIPSYGLAEVKSDMVPRQRLPELGAFNAEIHRPLRGNSPKADGGRSVLSIFRFSFPP